MRAAGFTHPGRMRKIVELSMAGRKQARKRAEKSLRAAAANAAVALDPVERERRGDLPTDPAAGEVGAGALEGQAERQTRAAGVRGDGEGAKSLARLGGAATRRRGGDGGAR